MHRRRALMIFAGFGLCPLCASIGVAAEESHHWSYEGASGPEKWGGLDAADAPCSAGDQQSPIDITGAISARQPPLKLSWSKRPDTIINNGHTIQLNFAGGNTLRVGDRSYGLTQFHFHHPSEHLVDGKGFAMEAHFVYAAENGGLAVLSACSSFRARPMLCSARSSQQCRRKRDRPLQPTPLLTRTDCCLSSRPFITMRDR